MLWWGHSDDVADFYAAADVVVLPSRAEGMALVPLEAMACGRSVVAFDVGGSAAERRRRGGGRAARATSPHWRQALAARLADPALAAAEGQTGRRRAETLFDRDRMTDQIATLVEKLVTEEDAE